MEKLELNIPLDTKLPAIQGFGNNYAFIQKQLGTVEPDIPISIVLPVYNRIDMLRRTIAMLTHQTYPLELIEVIIADDGSDDNPEQLIDEFKQFFEINYVRQRDEGYRLSHIRNLGVRSARHDNVIILDCDMAPVPNLVKTYAEWLVLDYNVILIGHRRYVDANDIPPKDVLNDPALMLDLPPVATKNKVMVKSPSKDWREPIYQETNMLLDSPHPFRTSSCGNVAFNRRIFKHAGDFDESFTAWGAEDNEFGYRVWNAGYYFIPLLDALGLHQEPPGGREFVDREAGKLVTRPMLLDKVPTYRTYNPELISTTPSITLFTVTKNNVKNIEDCIESVLSQTFRDFKLIICDLNSTDGTCDLLQEKYQDNPQIKIYQEDFSSHSDSYNFCVRNATGMYLMQIDPSETISQNCLEIMFNELEHDPNFSLVCGGTSHHKPKDVSAESDSLSLELSRIDSLNRLNFPKPVLFRKRDWSRAGGFNNHNSSHVTSFDFYFRLCEIGKAKQCLQKLTSRKSNDDISPDGDISEFKISINSILQRQGLSRFKIKSRTTKNEPKMAEEDPFVSIVIITKNRSHLIEDSIISCLNQTYQNFELVIVDDGSTDNTEQIIRKFNDERIRYLKKESSGIPKSRNFGVKESNGEYIVIMDDDDLMLPNRVREQVDAVTADFVGSHGGWIDQNSDYEHEYFPGAPHGYSQILFGGKVMLHPASMIRRDILLKFPYDEKYSFGTDYVMNLEIAKAGYRLNHTNSYILLRRFHGGNVTLTNAGEQQNTAKVRVREFLEELDEDTEKSMRNEWKNTNYCENEKPSFDQLQSYFPWLNLNNRTNQLTDEGANDNYDVSKRWTQKGNVLSFDALTRSVFFEMPLGWRLENTHKDLLRVAHYVLTSPWESGILDDWKPSRQKGWRNSLSFSGGVDSTACMLLMPSDTILCYHERAGFKSQLEHANAHHFIKTLGNDHRPVLVVKSNHEQIRTDRGKSPGFSTDLAAAVQNILLADYLQLRSIALGLPLENAYLFHGHTGRDFAETYFWKHHHEILAKAGLELVFPTAGVSEMINHKIVENSKYSDFAESCLRSNKQGSVCGKCWKCFRKNTMKGKGIEIVGEIAIFLEKRPLKQAVSTLYAIQRLPPHQLEEIRNSYPDLKDMLEGDYSFIEKYAPMALNLLPINQKPIIEERLDQVAKPMSEEEVERLLTIDLSKS